MNWILGKSSALVGEVGAAWLSCGTDGSTDLPCLCLAAQRDAGNSGKFRIGVALLCKSSFSILNCGLRAECAEPVRNQNPESLSSSRLSAKKNNGLGTIVERACVLVEMRIEGFQDQSARDDSR